MAHLAEPARGGEQTGSAPVVLLHGQPGGAADWAEVVAALPARPSPIAFDRPGWDGVRRATDLEGNAIAALERMDRAGAGQAVVVGHSLGGAIAAWLAATRPERVRALVLVAPAANSASLYRLDRWLAAPLVGELAAGLTLGGFGLTLAMPGALRPIAGLTGIDPAYLRRAATMIRRPAAWWSYSAEQRALVDGMAELERRLPAIRAPTIILTGSADRIIPPPSTRALADQIPGAELRVVEGAGHLLPQTRAAVVAAAVDAARGMDTGDRLRTA